MKKNWKYYFLMILPFGLLFGLSFGLTGCFDKSTPTPGPSSELREDQESPSISVSTSSVSSGGAGVFTQSVADWEDSTSSSSLPSFLITVKDQDTPVKNLHLSYYIYPEGQRLQDSYFQEFEPFEFNQWKVNVTKKNIAPASPSFVGTKKFILRLKATDGVNPASIKEVPFTLTNSYETVSIESDPSDIDLSLFMPSDPEVMLSEFPQRRPFPWVYATLFLRPKSSVPLRIQVDFEGYLENEIQMSQQQWQEDELQRSSVGDVERWSKAPVILEVKERKETGEWGEAETVNLPNKKTAYILNKGLLFIFKTENIFREFPLTVRSVASDLRIDHVKLQGKLKILSAPQNIEDPSFYLDSQNWNDITPADPFPVLKVVSK